MTEEYPVKRMPVTSTAINAVGYRRKSKVMVVEFVSGSAYAYGNVSRRQYAKFWQAESKGSWVALNLVRHPDLHPYQRIEA